VNRLQVVLKQNYKSNCIFELIHYKVTFPLAQWKLFGWFDSQTFYFRLLFEICFVKNFTDPWTIIEYAVFSLSYTYVNSVILFKFLHHFCNCLTIYKWWRILYDNMVALINFAHMIKYIIYTSSAHYLPVKYTTSENNVYWKSHLANTYWITPRHKNKASAQINKAIYTHFNIWTACEKKAKHITL